MEDSPSPFVRTAAHELIVEKRDRLVAERSALAEQRADILSRMRRVDRELSDCRAAARLFKLDIAFPDDDERIEMSRREREIMIEDRHQRMAQADAVRRAQRNLELHAPAQVIASAPTALPPPPQVPPEVKRPPLRDVIIEQLRIAGVMGAKAADIREYIERTFGGIIHEKTVGMTLYRLSKELLVRRDGHTWFIGAPLGEPVNPGGDTPGPEDLIG